MANKVNFGVQVLDDGRIKVDTGDLKGPHHHSADGFMKLLSELMGGPIDVKSTKGLVHHHHHNDQEQKAKN